MDGSDDGFHLQNVDEVVGFAWVSWQLKEDKFDQIIFSLSFCLCGLAFIVLLLMWFSNWQVCSKPATAKGL